MSEMNRTPNPQRRAPAAPAGTATRQPVRKKKQKSGLAGRIIRRTLLMFFTIVILLLVGAVMILNQIFNGPSTAARDTLVMSLTEASATKWVPGLFLDDELVAQIRANVEAELPDEYSNTDQIVINMGSSAGDTDEWANCPDGIRIEEIQGETYLAHIMIIRDPSKVYMATSTDGPYSKNTPGTRINNEIVTEGAIAAINAGAFNDDGTANAYVGAIPAGLVMAGGAVKSDTAYEYLQEQGFAGFNQDNILIVAKDMTAEKALELGIRDGCCFGPVLIMNGVVNQEAYNSKSGLNPRTAIGQRADGAVIFLCIDGRQAISLGGTYKDVIDIMVEYGAVNACNMDGGSSSLMYYKDTYGRFGEAGAYQVVNNPALLQKEPRRMPNFWMVRPAEEG